jgi:hypothetical protein
MATSLEILNAANLAMLMSSSTTTIAYTALTTSSTAVSSETVAITLPSITFRNDRAYKITYRGGLIANLGNQQLSVSVRKANATGNQYINGYRIFATAGGTVPFTLSDVFVNTSGANITEVLVGTVFVVAGGGTVQLSGNTNTPSYLMVEDVGIPSLYPNAPTLV